MKNIVFRWTCFGIGVYLQEYNTEPRMKLLNIQILFWSFFVRIK